MEEAIRLGIFGLGKMGTLHLEKYLSLPGVEIVGFYEPDTVRAREVIEKYSIPHFSAPEELLFEADAVIVASSTPSHFLTARHALLAGVHVLVEKPVTETVRQAEELVRIANEHKLVLQVGFAERFRLMRLMSACPKSRPLFVDAERSTASLGREKSIDVVPDLMLHDLDLVLTLMQEEPSRILACGTTLVREKTDVAVAHLDFPSGVMASLRVSRVANHPVRRLEILYESAVAKINFMENRVDVSYGNPGGDPEHQTHDFGKMDPLLEQCGSFISAVRGLSPVVVTGEDGLRSLRWAEAVVRAVKRRGQKRSVAKVVSLHKRRVDA